MNLPKDASSAAGLRTTAISIGIGLANGVLLFALMSIFYVRSGVPPEPVPQVTLVLWTFVLLLACAAAVWLWRIKIQPLLPHGAAYSGDQHSKHLQVLTRNLILLWAILEIPALSGMMLYFLYGSLAGLAGGLGVIWLGLLSTWPRKTWYGIR